MGDNRYQSDDHLTFSQRHGYEPLPEPMQLEELSDDLRREIWNATWDLLRSERSTRAPGTYLRPDAKYYFYEDTQVGLSNVSWASC